MTETQNLLDNCKHDVIDPRSLVSLLGGSVGDYIEILEVFLDDFPRLDRAWQSALEAGDLERIADTLHELAGALGSACSTGAQAQARALETLLRQGGELPHDMADRVMRLRVAVEEFLAAGHALRDTHEAQGRN